MDSYLASSIPRAYTDEFRKEVLRQLDYGTSLTRVSELMGVSRNSLKRWSRMAQAETQSQVHNAMPDHIPKDRLSPDAAKKQAPDLLQRGESIRQIAGLIGACPQMIYRWKDKVDALEHQPMDGSKGKPTESDTLSCMRTGGLNQDEASRQPNICRVSVKKKQTYDEEFKKRALRKLKGGFSIRKLSQLMGVSEQTLHNWRKEASLAKEIPTDTATDEPEDLCEKLRNVKYERDILKKALAILIRESTDETGSSPSFQD